MLYVQITPDGFVMQLHRIGDRQRLPSQPCQLLPQIQGMPPNSLRIPLADYVQLSLQAGFIQRHNLNLRQHLARLGRKSLSFSKSVELHDKVIGHYLNIKHYQ